VAFARMEKDYIMTKKTRFILFSFLATLFFLLAPLAAFYSQGYRFDFERRSVVQTGGLYFKVQPRGTQIYLNDKLIKKTSFVFGRALIENLLPKEYKIEIKKEGYFSWEKTLQVREKWVTDAKNVFLILQNPKFNILSNEIEAFFFSPGMRKIVLKKKNEKGWSLNLFDLERNNESSFLNEKEIGEKIALSGLQWSADSKKILLKMEGLRYFIFELDKERLISLDFLGKEISQVSFVPKNSQKIFFIQNITKKNNLFSADYTKKEVSQSIGSSLLTYQTFNNDLLWLDKNGILYLSAINGETITPLNFDPFPLKPASQYQLTIISPEKIFLQEENILYFFNQEEQSLEKISEKVKEIKISPDSKKIVYFTDSEIWILFLKNIEGEQPQRKEGEKLFLTRFSEKIEDVFWYTSHYVIFNADNSIKIAEIDDRNRTNIYELAQFKDPKIFWNKIDKKLYILSEGNFYSSEKLIR